VTLATDGTLSDERVLTGTANQITVTDGGAGSTVTLSTPQNLHTAATPTFASLTLSGLTAGRVPIVSTAGLLADNAALLWDNTNARLSVGQSITPAVEYARAVISDTNAITTYQQFREILKVGFQSHGSGDVRTGTAAGSFWAKDDASVVNKTITNVTNSAGLCRVTATSHGFSTGDLITVYGVGGATQANGTGWTITVIDANTFDLVGSSAPGAYTSGGTATNRGQLVPARFIVIPTLSRDYTTFSGDDANGITASNASDFKATDGFWITDERTTDASAWRTIISSDSASDYFLRFTGKFDTAAIDLASATPRDGTEPVLLLGANHNIQLDTATGTKIGTATTQKLGFFNATPIVQPSSTTDLRAALINLGLYATGGASPLDLNGGSLTALKATLATGTITSSTPALAMTQTWNSGGTAFTGFSFTVTKTAADGASKYFDILDSSASRLNLNDSGILTHTAKDGSTTSVVLVSHSNNLTANTTISTMTGEVSAGTVSTPLRSQATQVALRNAGFGWLAVDDATTATRGSSHRAAMDWVVTEDWTSTAQGMYLRFRTTAAGGTTTNSKVLITEQGIDINAGVNTPTNRGTTNPTNALNIFDGTAPVGTLTNGITLYSTAGATLLSPHDDEGNWIHDEINFKGRKLRVDMERLVLALDKLLGGGYVTVN
jgi:hypothetical protein